jgi:hypothetical protein
MFYYFDTTNMNGNTQRHIMQRLSDSGIQSFPLTDDNPNKPAYDAWLELGNTPEEWQPES